MKLVLALMVVLATAAVAAAVPAFTLPADIVIDITKSNTVDVFIGGENLTDNVVGANSGIQGMNLWMEVSEPFTLSNMLIDEIPGLLFTGNSTGKATSYDAPNIASGTVSTLSGFIRGPGDLARITVTVPANTPIGTSGTLYTWGYSWEIPSDFAGVEAGMDTARVTVTPEPFSALLLLAGLPLLRRRQA